MTIRVAFVDDQEPMGKGFKMILEAQPDIDVVGGADNEFCIVSTTPFASGFRNPPSLDLSTRRAVSRSPG